jgi:hypothetical protein
MSSPDKLPGPTNIVKTGPTKPVKGRVPALIDKHPKSGARQITEETQRLYQENYSKIDWRKTCKECGKKYSGDSHCELT